MNYFSDNILVKLFISEIVHTKDSFLLNLYYKFNFATEPYQDKKKLVFNSFQKNKKERCKYEKVRR